MAKCCLLVLAIFLPISVVARPFEDDARQALLASIESGEGVSDPLTAMAIAQQGGDETDAETQAQAVRDLVERIFAAGEIGSKSGKRKAKAWLKALREEIQLDETEPVMAAWTQGEAGPLGQALMMTMIAEKGGLDAGDLESLDGELDPYLTSGEKRSVNQVAAAYLVQAAYNAPAEDGPARYAMLRVSKALDADNAYGKDDIDRRLFNQALELYQAESFEAAGYLAAGGAERHPHIQQYEVLCYNAGVMLMQNATDAAARRKIRPLLGYLLPHTGENRDTFNQGLDTLAYNDAVDLYNDGDAAGALELLKKIEEPPKGTNYQALVGDCYTALIQEAVDAGEDTGELLDELAKFDPDRAAEITTRLEQLKIQALNEAGDYAAALEQAAKTLDAPNGKQNYLAVLVRYTKQLLEQKDFTKALNIQNDIPESLKTEEAVQDLRFNIYNNWLNSLPARDYDQQVPVYKQLFADQALVLTQADKKAFLNNWGNQVFYKAEALIAEEQFQAADELLKANMERFPGHKALIEVRANLDQILERVNE